MVDNILNDPTVNNKESLINGILNNKDKKKTTLEQPEIENNLEELKANIEKLTLEEPKRENNLEEPKINKEITTNNLEEPKTNNKKYFVNDNNEKTRRLIMKKQPQKNQKKTKKHN